MLLFPLLISLNSGLPSFDFPIVLCSGSLQARVDHRLERIVNHRVLLNLLLSDVLSADRAYLLINLKNLRAYLLPEETFR